jgi:uncharacterized protein (DUF58 family)
MIPRGLARRVREIEIRSLRAVDQSLVGEYRSVFKGQGMDFHEVREYQPGDEVRSIDWNVTARMGHPFTKRFVEERERTLLFLIDASASGAFGSRDKLKSEAAAEVCALLAFAAIRNHDRVGMLLFTDVVEHVIPPGKGAAHVLRVIRVILGFHPRQTGTNLALAAQYFARLTPCRCVVFVISDFLTEDVSRPLRILAQQHDVIAVAVTDQAEAQMPDAGLVQFEDAESGVLAQIDTRCAHVRQEYQQACALRRAQRDALFRWVGIDHVEIFADRDYLLPLIKFLRNRRQTVRAR